MKSTPRRKRGADDLVAAYGITGYEAQFVALALELGCNLYTQDKELLAKFPSIAKPFIATP